MDEAEELRKLDGEDQNGSVGGGFVETRTVDRNLERS
jgi:hypothetical protein